MGKRQRIRARHVRAAAVPDTFRGQHFQSAVAEARTMCNLNGIPWEARLVRGAPSGGIDPVSGAEFGVHYNSAIVDGKVVRKLPARGRAVATVNVKRGKAVETRRADDADFEPGRTGIAHSPVALDRMRSGRYQE